MANEATTRGVRRDSRTSILTGMALALAAAFAAAGVHPALAFAPKLNDEAVHSIIDAGPKMVADPKHGFQVEDYVLFDRKQPLHINDNTHAVDAVIVGTPREYLLYESYLQAFQGKVLSFAKARGFADAAAGQIRFRVFAHAGSVQPKDRDFLKKFGKATLALDNGKTLTAQVSDVSNPAEDFFIVGGNHHVFRWLGVLNYVFNLGPLAEGGADISNLSGTLTFTDNTGYQYRHAVSLGSYE